MAEYILAEVKKGDIRANRQIDELLAAESIRRDRNLDYTCAMYDEDMNVIATGSCFGNTLRCLAVSHFHQGEGLMNSVVTHLVQEQISRGNIHLFLYTKCESAPFFSTLGFYEIVRIDGQIVFMENRKNGFERYLNRLKQESRPSEKSAAVVMNANPFTCGHQYLVEKASAENDLVHLFIVSEDASLVPFSARRKMVMEGTSHLHNICYHDSGPYIISNATFPSYFQKNPDAVIRSHAMLDLAVFAKIASALGITSRYVGEEQRSHVTGIYNQIMEEKLPGYGVECKIVPRKECDGRVISASDVRVALKEQDLDKLKQLVPETTIKYFESQEGAAVIRKIQQTEDVVHY